VFFHFSKFKNQPYYKELNVEEGKTIPELAAIYYGTPYEEDKDYEDYEDIDDEEEPMIYEEEADADEDEEEPQVAEEDKNEEPPELELKQLPEELRYECLDELKKMPVIISSKLSPKEEESL
jgi:hypothetical protein